MIKSTRHVRFDSDISRLDWALDCVHFSDKHGNKVVVYYDQSEIIDLSFRVFDKAFHMWAEYKISVLNRDKLVSLVQDATQYLEQYLPVDA